MAGQPILILREGTGRTRGRDAQRMNIMAAHVIAESVKSTLGPQKEENFEKTNDFLFLQKDSDPVIQKCLCGAALEVIKSGRVLRCPVEGITYTYPVPSIVRAIEVNNSSRRGKENKKQTDDAV